MNNNFVISKRKTYAILALIPMLCLAFSVVLIPRNEGSFHVYVYVQRVGEVEPTFWSYHAGSLTTQGKNFIEGKLGDKTFADNNHYAIYGSLSCAADAFNAAWIDIVGEITIDGLERAEMTYASTGNGVWTLTKQWTSSGTHTNVQRIGINFDSAANDGSLVWADTISVITLTSGDKITIVATTTVT